MMNVDRKTAAYLVQCLFDVLELLRGEVGRIDTFDPRDQIQQTWKGLQTLGEEEE